MEHLAAPPVVAHCHQQDQDAVVSRVGGAFLSKTIDLTPILCATLTRCFLSRALQLDDELGEDELGAPRSTRSRGGDAEESMDSKQQLAIDRYATTTRMDVRGLTSMIGS